MSESTILLDCSHQQSSEYIAGNKDSNALYTNKLGSGIRVNAGDKVSIHQSYISEIGSDDNALQITDKFIGRRDITYTLQTPINYVNGSNDKMLGYERITASNTTLEVDVYENKTTILYNYYITNHGEIAYSLPRRFVWATNSGGFELSVDSENAGRPFGSYALSTSVGSSFNNDTFSLFFTDEDAQYFQNASESASASNRIKPILNNSRFKIFTLTETRYGSQSDSLDDIMSASLTTPAALDYIEYIEKLDVEVGVGFKSPEAIANTLTNTLTRTRQPQLNTAISRVAYNTINVETNRRLNTEINSETFHTFYAGSVETNSSATYSDWAGTTGDNDGGLKYLSSYQYIGIKRPELWIKGREFNNYWVKTAFPTNTPNLLYSSFIFENDLEQSKFERGSTDDDAHQLVLSVDWDDKEAMRLLANIFNEQGNHPELFDNKYNQMKGFTTVNNSRFLHMNLLSRAVRSASTDSIHGDQLGCDYYQINSSGSAYMNTIPLFFDYNASYKDIETEGNSWEDGYSYGVFKRFPSTTSPSGGYVSITTSHLGILEDTDLSASFTTIPLLLFNLNDGSLSGSLIDRRTSIGWDTNFNSYGNVVVGLNNGWGETAGLVGQSEQLNIQLPTAYSSTQFPTYRYNQQVYLGANEPLIEYNTVSNRFEISQLHTTERIQNRHNAGSTQPIGDIPIEEFETGGDKVYKINKRLFLTSWNPDVIPYKANELEFNIGSVSYNVDFLNPNLKGWTIFDQLSGIVIKDFGYNENQWTQGLWETLGFSYIQFNSSVNSDNDFTTRVTNQNKQNLPYAFTNADVDQLTSMDLVTNIWGAGMYNLQMPQTMSFAVNPPSSLHGEFFRSGMKLEQFPAITKKTVSMKLQADNLPRKLSSPYFCIRSDILDDPSYIGGEDSGQLYPVIATIPKSNDYGDYFVGLDSPIEFTFTRPKTISSIVTSIHNPDQTLSNVDESSAVIYKITKMMNPNRFNIIQQIMSEEKK